MWNCCHILESLKDGFNHNKDSLPPSVLWRLSRCSKQQDFVRSCLLHKSYTSVVLCKKHHRPGPMNFLSLTRLRGSLPAGESGSKAARKTDRERLTERWMILSSVRPGPVWLNETSSYRGGSRQMAPKTGRQTHGRREEEARKDGWKWAANNRVTGQPGRRGMVSEINTEWTLLFSLARPPPISLALSLCLL